MAILSIEGTQISLEAAYHPELACQAGAFRGRFNGTRKCWMFDARWEAELRALCQRLYGVDGRPESAADITDITVEVEETRVDYPLFRMFNADIYVAGRQVAGVLKGRTIVRPGKGIRFVKGEPVLWQKGMGWWLSIPSGTQFVMRAVPRMAVPFVEGCLAGHGSLVSATTA